MLGFLKRKFSDWDFKMEWNVLGREYATAVNEMVDFGEKHGWDKWEGENPENKRIHLGEKVFKLLKKANSDNAIDEFRKTFPPAHAPFHTMIQDKGQGIEHLHFIENDKIVFLVGTGYSGRKAHLLDGTKVTELDPTISAVGKSKRNNVFATIANDKIVTTQGWEGPVIRSFDMRESKGLEVIEVIPFNDGQRILLNTHHGMFLISDEEEIMFHPVYDKTYVDEEMDGVWDPYIDMGNATISNDNRYIVVGDQGADHRILNQQLQQIGQIGPQSSYPHYCIFSADDSQLITNSCHFYNGITIAVSTENIDGLKVEAYKESELFKVVDEEMRVYIAATTKELYIFGDAYGYIRAFNKKGDNVWRHFVGSTISGLTISHDEQTVWVATYAGMIHKLSLGKGHRDDHTIGNGDHYEEFRLICWKEEPMLVW